MIRSRILPMWSCAAFVVVVSVSGCDSLVGPNDPSSPGIRTVGSNFVLSQEQGLFTGDIPYVYTNRTESAVYIVNCLGMFGVELERFDSGRWIPIWSPVIPACLSAPIVVEPGATFEGTLYVAAGAPGSNYYPRLERSSLSGVFRIVVAQALSSFQDSLPFGKAIEFEHRVSNSFRLEVQ